MKIEKVAVIGSGTMGSGIAHIFALNGYDTVLIDVSEVQIEKAKISISANMDRQLKKGAIDATAKEKALKCLRFGTDMKSLCIDRHLVIEAASENLSIKTDIFVTLSNIVASDTILATNTSSISITKIASHVKFPERVIGMHFMNPVPLMKLVEVIKGYNTSAEVCTMIMELSLTLGKTPVEVNDYYGFVSNRILMPMINEAIQTLFENVAGVDEIDTVMKLGMNHPMGPLQLADFIGLDVCYYILNVLYEGFKSPKYAPCPLLENMVLAGKLGVKTGEGFYTYDPETKVKTVSTHFSKY